MWKLTWNRPSDIAQKVSGGSMLCGTLYKKDTSGVFDYEISKNQLVSVPDDSYVNDFMPCMPTQCGRISLFSDQETKAFKAAVNGSTISLGAKVEFRGLTEFAGLGMKWQKGKSIGTVDVNIQRNVYYAEVLYKFIPVACIQLKPDKLRLSDTSKKEIDKISQIIQNPVGKNKNKKRKDLYKACEIFFKDFGSHINVGRYHLGAMVLWTSTFDGCTTLSLHQVENLVSKALAVNVGFGFGGVGIKVQAGLKALNKVCHNEEELNCMQMIKHDFHKHGGPPINDKNWVNSLENQSDKWAIIDRGDASAAFHIGVWDLIRCADPPIVNALWTPGTMYDFYCTYEFRENIYQVIQNPNLSFKECLQMLEKIINERKHITNNDDEWKHLLTDDQNVPDHFEKNHVVDQNDVVEVFRIIDLISPGTKEKLQLNIVKRSRNENVSNEDRNENVSNEDRNETVSNEDRYHSSSFPVTPQQANNNCLTISEDTFLKSWKPLSLVKLDMADIDKLIQTLGNFETADDYRVRLENLKELVGKLSNKNWLRILNDQETISGFLLKPARDKRLQTKTNFKHIKFLFNYATDANFPKKWDIEVMIDKFYTRCACFGLKLSECT